MHELSVTQSVLELALKHADRAEASVITDLFLVIGSLSSVVDSSVQFYWDIISQGTPAEGARLHFERVPLRLRCTACQHSYTPGADSFDCPACGSSAVRVVTGDEFFLRSIEIENGAEP